MCTINLQGHLSLIIRSQIIRGFISKTGFYFILTKNQGPLFNGILCKIASIDNKLDFKYTKEQFQITVKYIYRSIYIFF